MSMPRRMFMMGTFLGLAGALFLASEDTARADDVDADKIIGTWVMSKHRGIEVQDGDAYTFTKKKEVTTTSATKAKGTYKIDGNKLTMSMKIPVAGAKGKKAPTKTLTTNWIIVTLTDDVMVLKGDRGEIETEYKKKK